MAVQRLRIAGRDEDEKRGQLCPSSAEFLHGRLMQQKQASPHTICSYRDTFRLLLRFLEKKLRKPPSRLVLDEVGASSNRCVS